MAGEPSAVPTGGASSATEGASQGGTSDRGAAGSGGGGAGTKAAGAANTGGAATHSGFDCSAALLCVDFEDGYGDAVTQVGQGTHELVPMGARGSSQSMHVHVEPNDLAPSGFEAALDAGAQLWGRAYVMRGEGNDPERFAGYMKFWGDADGWPAIRIATQGGLMANYADFGAGGNGKDKSIEADTNYESGGVPGLYGRESFPSGEWVCLEWHIDADADTLSLWRNGRSYMTNKTPPGESDWVPGLSHAFVGIDAEWNDQPAMDLWWDEIVFASERVGCE